MKTLYVIELNERGDARGRRVVIEARTPKAAAREAAQAQRATGYGMGWTRIRAHAIRPGYPPRVELAESVTEWSHWKGRFAPAAPPSFWATAPDYFSSFFKKHCLCTCFTPFMG